MAMVVVVVTAAKLVKVAVAVAVVCAVHFAPPDRDVVVRRRTVDRTA